MYVVVIMYDNDTEILRKDNKDDNINNHEVILINNYNIKTRCATILAKILAFQSYKYLARLRLLSRTGSTCSTHKNTITMMSFTLL